MDLKRLWLSVLLLVACNPFDDEDDRPRTRTEFCQDWGAAACTKEVVSVCQASSADECQDTQAKFCRDLVSDDFSGAKADVCLSAVATAYRDADLRGDELALVLRMGGPCTQVIAGPQELGEDCLLDSDCDQSSGHACVHKADADMGTCQIPQQVGAGRDCKAAQKTCEPGFFCDGRNCIEGLRPGDACTIQEQCGDDGFCSDSGECVRRFAVNDSCENDWECVHGVCNEFEGRKTCTDRILLSRAEPICADLR